jgi:hypothetical protein
MAVSMSGAGNRLFRLMIEMDFLIQRNYQPYLIRTQSTGKSSRTPINKEKEVKKFMFLHFGFQKPTPEIMEAWEAWFESISDKQVEQGGFSGAREISNSGTRDLPWNMDSITGYNIVEAESLDAAEKLAQSNPFIASIRIYEVRSM